jgi:hypothetical protein
MRGFKLGIDEGKEIWSIRSFVDDPSSEFTAPKNSANPTSQIYDSTTIKEKGIIRVSYLNIFIFLRICLFSV